MRPLCAIALAGMMVAPCSVAARTIDGFAMQAKQQHEARRAEMEEIQERADRRHEWQQQREIDHPSVTDEDDDDLDDDSANHARRH